MKKILSVFVAAAAVAALAGPLDPKLSIEKYYGNQIMIRIHQKGVLQKFVNGNWEYVAEFTYVPNYLVTTNCGAECTLYRIVPK